MTRIVKFKDEARLGIKAGVDLIADAVKATLGPRGKNVIYSYHYGNPISTKDGVTVARQVESKDELQQLGVLMVREVAQKTADDSGDGTTTASLLAQAIYSEGLRCLNTGVNSVLIKKGIDKAVDEVVQYIDTIAKPINSDDEARQIAMISANNDTTIGDSIAYAISIVGKNGVITLEDNHTGSGIEVVVEEGMQLSEGMLSPFFMTDPEKLIAEYVNPKILIVDGELADIMPIKGLIEECIATHKQPLVIMAHNITGVALQAMAMSKAQKGVPILGCKLPQFGEYRENLLEDLSILTKSAIMGGKFGVRAIDLKYEMLGSCDKVTSDRFKTTFIGGHGDKDKIQGRINLLEQHISKSISDYDKEKLQERLAKLTSGVAVVRVGGRTEVEQKEKKMRVEDSLLATQAAMEEGIVPGGGTVLLRCSKELTVPQYATEEEKVGYNIIKKALREPILQIASNSGISGEEIIANVLLDKSHTYGYDFLGNRYGDMYEMGVIDPAKVVKNSLRNAASVAGTLLTTEVAIYEELGDVDPAMTPKAR